MRLSLSKMQNSHLAQWRGLEKKGFQGREKSVSKGLEVGKQADSSAPGSTPVGQVHRECGDTWRWPLLSQGPSSPLLWGRSQVGSETGPPLSSLGTQRPVIRHLPLCQGVKTLSFTGSACSTQSPPQNYDSLT